MNQSITLNNRPAGKPEVTDFTFLKEAMPVPEANEILLKTCFVSVDPYLRGRMRDEKSYIAPFQLNEPLSSGCVAEVIVSNNPNFQKGDYVCGMLQWKEFQTSDGKQLYKVDATSAPLSAYLGVLGITGLTAYFGLSEIGKLKKGETLVVSGAAGAVGSTVGQIGKIMGCKVIGIAGTDEKVALMKTKFGYDHGINYRTVDNMFKALKESAPEGIDVYFDNVGGAITDAVLQQINTRARIVMCGAISVYNETKLPLGPRVETTLIKNSALMQGFIVTNYEDRFVEGIMQLSKWMQEGKLTYSETVVQGFDAIPKAFIGLFEGRNKGKMVVKI